MLSLKFYQIVTSFIKPIFFIYFIIRLLKNKEQKGKLFERMGFSKIKKPPGKLIWIHAVSVGETLSSFPLIDQLNDSLPEFNILLTTGTKTSRELVLERGLTGVIHQYFPWDIKSYCNRFLDHWKPDISVFIESEIWPNHLIQIKKRGIPILLVNARITEKSKNNWIKFKKTIEYLLSIFSIIISQDNLSKNRLEILGGKNILMYGNLKHDSKILPFDLEVFKEFEESSSDKIVLVAASTHPGEEEIILETFTMLLTSKPNLFLVLAPRHPDRRADVIKKVISSGFSSHEFILRSNSLKVNDNTKICILDSIGELGYFYKKANSVILGGAFEKMGGHNPIEAAHFSNAIFTGPNFYNFEDEYNNLINCNGAKVIYDYGDLSIINDNVTIKEMGLNSKNYSYSVGGSANKVASKIVGLLNEN